MQFLSDISARQFPGIVQGRLTAVSGSPVPTTDTATVSTLYFSPYKGNVVTVYNGSLWVPYTFSELSLTLSGLTSGKNYDVFAYVNGGALTFDLGPAWSTDTSRGTGAGTTELQLVSGVWTNKVALTTLIRSHSVSANQGVYIGTIRTISTSATTDSLYQRYVYNAYNRVGRKMYTVYSSAHTYTTASWRAWNSNTTEGQARMSFVMGLVEDAIEVLGGGQAYNTAATDAGFNGVGLNTTSASSTSNSYWQGMNASTIIYGLGSFGNLLPGLGYNYLNATQLGNASTSLTYLLAQIDALIFM